MMLSTQRVRISLLAILILASGAIPAAEYINAEETAVDSIDDIPDPGTVALAAPVQQEPAAFLDLQRFLQDSPAWIKDSTLQLSFRGYGFERENRFLDPNEALALGGELNFETGTIANLLRVGLGYHFSEGLHAPSDTGGTKIVRHDGGNLSVFSSAYLQLGRTDRIAGLIGRRGYLLPYINKNDHRMIPITHEGYLMGRSGTDKDFVFGHFTKVKLWDSEEFISMSEAAGAVGTNEGVTALGARFDLNEHTNIFALGLYGWDTFATYYAEANWLSLLLGDRGLKAGAQYTRQKSVGKQLVGNFDTSQFGLKWTMGFGSLLTRFTYTRTGRDAAVRSPWGGRPTYNSMMIEEFSAAGQRAARFSISLTGSRWGRPAWSGSVSIAHGFDAQDPDSMESLADVNEVDLTIDYRPESGVLRGLWFRIRHAYADYDDGTSSRNIRLIINYALPIL